MSLQAHPEHVRDKDRCGTSESLDPPVPGEEGALSAPQTAAVRTSLNQVSAHEIRPHTHPLTLCARQVTFMQLYEYHSMSQNIHQGKPTNLSSSLKSFLLIVHVTSVLLVQVSFRVWRPLCLTVAHQPAVCSLLPPNAGAVGEHI